MDYFEKEKTLGPRFAPPLCLLCGATKGIDSGLTIFVRDSHRAQEFPTGTESVLLSLVPSFPTSLEERSILGAEKRHV